MRKFTENQPLLASIKANDIVDIKRILIDNIFFLQGDQNEINRAVEYAKKNSDFKFEEHQQLEVSDKNRKKDYFSEEKWNLKKNFSRDRYDLLVQLYNETFAKQEYTYESESTSENNGVVRNVVIGGTIIIAGYLIYKTFT